MSRRLLSGLYGCLIDVGLLLPMGVKVQGGDCNQSKVRVLSVGFATLGNRVFLNVDFKQYQLATHPATQGRVEGAGEGGCPKIDPPGCQGCQSNLQEEHRPPGHRCPSKWTRR